MRNRHDGPCSNRLIGGDVRHFIITRNSYPPGYPGLAQRAVLLREYVLPSLRNQRNRDFTWVLTSPEGTQDLELEGIDHVVLDVPAPPAFDSTTYMVQEIVSRLAADLPAGEVVISTRLDNDDILLPTYVADVQAAAVTMKAPALLDAPGFRVDMRFGKVYRDIHYARRRLPSPFISLVESKSAKGCRIASAYYDQHLLMHRHFPLSIVDRPGWVQLIHGTNKVMSRPEEEVARRGEVLDVAVEDFLAAVLSGDPLDVD